VDLLHGQKTGFYFDQRENRALLAGLQPAGRVLDCFCYTGAWSLSLAAAREGIEVLGLDESRPAVDLARENAALNGLDRYVRFEPAEVFQALEALAAEQRRFECVILDPPAMVKSRARIMEGYRGYRRLHRLAARVVAKRGLLATSCCSYHLGFEQFAEAVAEGLARSDRNARVIHVGRQASDHPIHPAIPESNYLKFMLLEVD
jgi:23S rRNA (cytosine1962-C5)-methyltransferase